MDGFISEAPVIEYPYADAKKAYRRVGAALFALILAVQLSAIVLSAVVYAVFPSIADTSWFMIVFNWICLYGIGAPFYYLIMKKAPAITPPKKKMGGGSFAVAALMAVGLIFSLNLITVIIITALEYAFDITLTSNLDALLGNANIWLAVISTVVVAPLLEELFFRRMICDRLTQYGEWQAILFSALAFSMFHTSIHQALYAFGLGCLFGLVYVRTGKLRYTVILHAIVNFVGSVPGLLMMKYGVEDIVLEFSELSAGGDMEKAMEFFEANLVPILCYLMYSMVLFSVTIAGVVLCFVFLKKIITSADGKLMPRRKRFSTMFSGVLTVLFFVICIGLTVAAMFMV